TPSDSPTVKGKESEGEHNRQGSSMTRFLFNFAHWLDQTFARNPARPKIKSCHLRLEALEERALLSISQFFPTDLRAFSDGVHPLGGSGPSGYTPSQIRHAYGFDQITF